MAARRTFSSSHVMNRLLSLGIFFALLFSARDVVAPLCRGAAAERRGYNAQAEPLRVFIRGGVKTHGPNAHEHARFLNDWKVLLAERGIKTDGAKDWPNAMQLSKTDVL